MKAPDLDPERIAALLDGRLDERERRDLLDSLAASDDALALYADAAAALREVEGDAEPAGVRPEEVDSSVVPLRPTTGPAPGAAGGERAAAEPRGERAPAPKRPRGFRAARWMALAASIAVLALIPAVWPRTEPGDGSSTYVTLLQSRDGGLPANWDGTPWPTTRAAGDPLTAAARAVRVGARLADLELLTRAGDPRAAPVAAEIATLLDDVAGGGAAVEAVNAVRARVASGTRVEPQLVQAAYRSAAAVAGQELVEVGTWLEAARVAAAQRDVAFFRTPESRAALDRADGAETTRAPAPNEAAQIRRLVSGPGAPDWDAVTRALARVLGALGR